MWATSNNTNTIKESIHVEGTLGAKLDMISALHIAEREGASIFLARLRRVSGQFNLPPPLSHPA